MLCQSLVQVRTFYLNPFQDTVYKVINGLKDVKNSLCCILTLFRYVFFIAEIISPHCVSIASKQKKIFSVLASRGLPSFVILQATFNNFIELFFFQTSLHTLSNFNKIAIQTLPQAEKEKQLRIHWRQDYSLRQVSTLHTAHRTS